MKPTARYSRASLAACLAAVEAAGVRGISREGVQEATGYGVNYAHLSLRQLRVQRLVTYVKGVGWVLPRYEAGIRKAMAERLRRMRARQQRGRRGSKPDRKPQSLQSWDRPFEHRVVPAGSAPAVPITGPVSVWDLARVGA